jgi:hypothetical protein
MAINERARDHYDNACEFQQSAMDAETFEDAMKFTNLGELSVKLAQFCVDNHALVSGVDEALSQNDSVGLPKPWGGLPVPPIPEHIARMQEQRRLVDPADEIRQMMNDDADE